MCLERTLCEWDHNAREILDPVSWEAKRQSLFCELIQLYFSILALFLSRLGVMTVDFRPELFFFILVSALWKWLQKIKTIKGDQRYDILICWAQINAMYLRILLLKSNI